MIVGPVRGLRWFQAFFFLKTKNASTANMAIAATMTPAIIERLMPPEAGTGAGSGGATANWEQCAVSKETVLDAGS